MKKRKMLLPALVLFSTVMVNAQRKISLAYNYPPPISKTEAIFSNSGSLFFQPHRLQILAKNQTRIDIRLQNMTHLHAVLNLDSLLNIVWSEIMPLKDSFPDDLNNRLLNVNLSSTGKTKIRISTYPPKGNSFVKTGEGLARLKIEQDTLHIIGFVREERKFEYYKNMKMIALEKTDHGTYINYIP